MSAVVLQDLYRDPSRVVVTAHRGWSQVYPENTLLAFGQAVEVGADLVEFDLRGSREREPVILHDPVIDRTSDGEGAVGDYSLGDLVQFDFSGGRSEPQRIPTFEQALDTIPDAVGLNIQVKETDPPLLGRICSTYRDRDLYQRAYLTVSTFREAELVRAIDPGIALCILERKQSLDRALMERMKTFGVFCLQPHRRDVTPALCDAIGQLGLAANMFYSNTDEDNRRFVGYGIRGILTDAPDVLIGTLAHLKRRR